jgi:hypothetical protein
MATPPPGKEDSKPKPSASGGGGKKFSPKAPAKGSGLPSFEISSKMVFMTGIFGVVGVLLVKFIVVWKIFASIISMVAIFVIIYAGVRLREILLAEKKKIGHLPDWTSDKTKKNERWERIETYMRSDNPSDWKIAVLEADNILDDVVLKMGYPGETLGERMKAINTADFPYLNEAWEAHKIRNQIAHKGTDYTLTKSVAEYAINIYHRIFKSLGYLE